MKTRYYSFNQYLQARYGTRVHRLSLNAGFTCPNRDGHLGARGCAFCNEKGFSRFAGKNISPREQVESSIAFAKERFKAKRFIAYFQNATGTYAPVDELKRAYDIVKDFSDIIGLFISTRPDCVDEERLDLIQSYKKKYEVWIEYGIQTIHDRSLEMMNRRHTFSQSVEAVRKTAERGIKAAAHIILGLPGESWKDMVKTARMLSRLPVFGVKFHALHVAKDTELESLYDRGEVELMSRGDYVTAACDFLENLRSDCVIFRLISDARDEVLVAPKWINDKARIIREIDDELEARGTRQGILAPGEAGRPSNSIV